MLPNLAGIRLAPASLRGRRREASTGARTTEQFLKSDGILQASSEVRGLVADLLSAVIVMSPTVRAWEQRPPGGNPCRTPPRANTPPCLPGNLEHAPDSIFSVLDISENVELEGMCHSDRPMAKLRAFIRTKIYDWLGPTTVGTRTFLEEVQSSPFLLIGNDVFDRSRFATRLTKQVNAWLSTGMAANRRAWPSAPDPQFAAVQAILQDTLQWIMSFAATTNAAETAQTLRDFMATLPDQTAHIPRILSVPGTTKLGCETQAAVRSNPEHMSGLALLAYKFGWDELIVPYDQQLTVGQTLRSLRAHKGADYDLAVQDKMNKMAPLMLAFLDLPTLRSTLVQYVGSPSQVGSNHYLNAWLGRGSNREDVLHMLSRMPADGLELWPYIASECFTQIKLNAEGQWSPTDLALNQTMATLASSSGPVILGQAVFFGWNLVATQPTGPGVQQRDDVAVWPYFQGGRVLLDMTLGNLVAANDNRPDNIKLALEHLEGTILRIKDAIEPLYKPIGNQFQVVTLWRDIAKGDYPNLDALAAQGQYDALAAALIPDLQQTMVATSRDIGEAMKFARKHTRMAQDGILIRFTGTCRGIDTNEVLKGRWECFPKEQEIVMAPDQHYAHDPNAEPRGRNGPTRGVYYHYINMRVAYKPNTQNRSEWVYGDDPHWQLRAL